MRNVICDDCRWMGERLTEGRWIEHGPGGRYTEDGFRREVIRARTAKPCPKCGSKNIRVLRDPVTGRWFP